MIDLGIVKPGSTIRIPFSSFDKDDGSAITMTNFAVADILAYKDGSTTERASTAGYTATTDFDGKTGKHLAIIDLADNTTAGHWAAGSENLIAIDAVTVDAVTTGGWVARFVIGYPDAHLNTTIATLSSQTSFTLTAGPAEDDALNGCVVLIHDVASAVQFGYAVVSDYTGSTKTVTLTAGVTFTAAATDNISFFPPGNARWFAALLGSKLPLAPATAGRDLVVDAAGLADANMVKAGPTGSGTAQTAGDIIGDTNDIQSRLPAALVGGRMDCNVGAISSDTSAADNCEAYFDGTGYTDVDNLAVIRSNTAQAGAPGTITLDASANATDDFYNNTYIQITAGTGVGQARFISDYVGATKAASVNTNWITSPDNTSVFIIWPFGTIPGASAPTAAEVADAVWDEALSGHQTTGTAGRNLTLAGTIIAETTAAGTPTTTTLQLTSGSAVDDFYNDLEIIPTSGALSGQARVIADYVGGTTTITVDEAWTSAPATGISVLIRARHSHSKTQIGTEVWATAARTLTAIDEDSTTLDLDATIRTAVGLASANLDTQLTAIDDLLDTELPALTTAVADLPTNAELATALGTADDAVLAQVALIKAKTDSLTFTTANQVDSTMMTSAAGAITASTIATGAIDADSLATDAVNEIADGVLDRNMATGTDSGSTTVRTPRQAMRALRNRVAISGGTATVYKEDDATSSFTAAVTTTAGDPISEVNPAGP